MITQSVYADKEVSILLAALRLFIEYGFHGTPTSKIASEAGVAHGTLFHYFKTKDELVLTLYNAILDSFHQYLSEKAVPSASLKERFKNLFYYSVQWSLRNKHEFYFTQQVYYSPHFKQVGANAIGQQTSLHRALYLEAQQVGVFKQLPVDMIVSLAMNQLIGAYEYLVNAALSEANQSELIDEISELTWTMFVKMETRQTTV